MAVVAQGEGLVEASLQGLEASEMPDPFLIGQGIEADPGRPAPVAVA
jgi:hypothetical protein